MSTVTEHVLVARINRRLAHRSGWPRGKLQLSEGDDTIIVITSDNIDAFIDRLTDIAGIPSVGK